VQNHDSLLEDKLMAFDVSESHRTYTVVVNGEEQYSIWANDRTIPPGWKPAKTGSRDECLAYIEHVWTDMRPLSVRKRENDASGVV
jgi:MbtH protein